MKLNGSVGRMGRNDKADVALVQDAFTRIKIRGKFGRQSLWKGRVDGRNSRDLEAAIGSFQAINNLRPTGKLEASGPAVSKLRQAVPSAFRSARPVRGTRASVSGQADPQRAAMKEADRIKTSAPFPDKERTALADAVRRVGKELNIVLTCKRDWITQDGRFATELRIDGDLSGSMAEQNQIIQKITRMVAERGVWEGGNPNNLEFRSKRQLAALKGTAKTLSAADKELLELTRPPKDPLLAAYAQGCARLIRTNALETPKGKEEHKIILDAVMNADPALGKGLRAATDGEARLRKELAALEGAGAAMARTLNLDSNVRLWYAQQIKKMSDELLAAARFGRIPWEDARLQAHEARGAILDDARDKGSAVGRKWAETIKKTNKSLADIDAKILADEFGGRSIESLTKTEQRRFFQLAIESAGRSSPSENKTGRLLGRIGKGLWVLTFATAAYSVYVADDQVREFARQSTIVGGGVLGGMAGGALAGAAAGAATGPFVVIFVAGGVLVGGILASLGAEFAFDELID
jgi:hypothetical protein